MQNGEDVVREESLEEIIACVVRASLYGPDILDVHQNLASRLFKELHPDNVPSEGEEVALEAVLVDLERHLLHEMVFEGEVVFEMVNLLNTSIR